MTILFLHGWHSVPGGVKPTYLKDHGHEVINPALDDNDIAAALATAQAEFDKHQPQVVVGSSRGGAVAMNIKSGNAKLVLLCPAWKKYRTARTVKPGTMILHSRNDDVIPFADSEDLVRNSGLPSTVLIEIGSDHRLAESEPLERMMHSFKNESDLPAKMLISVAPAGLEQTFFECGVPVAQGTTTAPPSTKNEIEKLLEIAPRFGIEIRLPHSM